MALKLKEFAKFISSMCITFGMGTLIFNIIFVCLLSNIPCNDFLLSIPFGLFGVLFGGISRDKKLIYISILLIILKSLVMNLV